MKATQWPWKNPVIVKEVRTRMRGSRTFILVTVHLLVLALIVSLAYTILKGSVSTYPSLEERAIFGKAVFGLLVSLELLLVCFTAPALTSGSISLERERQTYDLLRVTLLPARSLVLGKYLSGLVFIFLLLFTSLPLQAPAFLFGGVFPEEILISVLILAVTAIAFCATGIFLSSLFSRTIVSTVIAYAVAIFNVFGIPIIILIGLFIISSIGNSRVQLGTPGEVILVLTGWILLCLTPLGTILGTEIIFLSNEKSIWWVKIPLSNNAFSITLISPWIPYVITYLLLSALLLWISIQRVRQVEK